MRRWLLVIGGILLFCVVAGAVGAKYAVNRVQNELSAPLVHLIALSVEDSTTRAIESQTESSEELRLSPDDFDINTVVGPAGESGFEMTTGGDESTVLVYGATSRIDESGVTVALADMEYHGIPSVRDGRVEFEDSTITRGITGWILDPEAIEQGFETGLNDALAASDLVPIAIVLGNDQMTIEVATAS